MLPIFRKKKSPLEKLDIAKKQLHVSLSDGLKTIENDLTTMRETMERLKSAGNKQYDHFNHLCVHSSLTSADCFVLTGRIRLCESRMERLFCARILAMIIIEYLDDAINTIGRDLVNEFKRNQFSEFCPELKNIGKKFSELRKQHESTLRSLRNNAAAHKGKNSLLLVNQIFSIDPEEIFQLGIEVMNINTEFTNLSTKVYYKMLNLAKKQIEN